MDIKQTIAANLAAWMADSPSLDTLKKLSARSGVSYGTIQRARNAEANLTIENLCGLADAFGRSVADLITTPSQPENAEGLLLSGNTQEVHFAAESRREYVVSWPFKYVSQKAYEALPPDGQAWVQGRIDATIEQALVKFGTQPGKRSA